MKTTFLNTSRRGFTLIETIVTVGLIAVLAAFIIPTVMQKAGVADPVKVQNDLGSLQTAISGFVGDTKGARPATLLQMTQAVSGTDAQLASDDRYTADQQAAWKGPYLGTEVQANAQLLTGYGLKINQPLEDFDAVTNTGRVGNTSPTDTPLVTGGLWVTTDARFVAARIDNVPVAEALAINTLFDGTEGTTTTSTTQLTGRIRFGNLTSPAPTTGNTVSVYYLALPISKL